MASYKKMICYMLVIMYMRLIRLSKGLSFLFLILIAGCAAIEGSDVVNDEKDVNQVDSIASKPDFVRLAYANLDSIEMELVNIYDRIWDFYRGDFDSLNYYSNLFSNTLKELVFSNPNTMTYPFEKLQQDRSIHIVTSSDGLFRIYSWDTQLGGTMYFYDNIFQYRSDSLSQVHVMYATQISEEPDPNTFFTGLHCFNSAKGTVYLATTYNSFSSRFKYLGIKGFEIHADVLIDTVKLVEGSDWFGWEIDLNSVRNNDIDLGQLIQFDSAKNELTVPVVVDNDQLTAKKQKFIYNGKYYIEK